MSQFICNNCSFISEVEPEYNEEQEIKSRANKAKCEKDMYEYERVISEFNELNLLCKQATTEWETKDKNSGLWEKVTGFFSPCGKRFKQFIKQNYPQLIGDETVYLGATTIFPGKYPDVHLPIPEPMWNYSYICPNCGFKNTYWKSTKNTEGGEL